MGQQLTNENDGPSWRDKVMIFVDYIKEYCTNCRLVGLSYIANHNLHFTERIFWMICLIVSVMGVSYLISEYQQDFSTRAVSVVHESISPFAPIQYPSISVCQLPSDVGNKQLKYVQSLGRDSLDLNVRDHLAFIIFPERYSINKLIANCQTTIKCEECAQCPLNGYRQLSTWFSLNCSDLFNGCSFSGKTFDCCHYFLPLWTPYGRCFLLNSLQNNNPRSEHWLPTIIDRNDKSDLQLVVKQSVRVDIFNEEDLPNPLLPSVNFVSLLGMKKYIKFYTEALVNDPEIKDIIPEARDCYFPDEIPPWSIFKAYSYSACISDCTRIYQMERCNCSLYHFNPFNDERFPDCDYNGYLCVEQLGLIGSDMRMMNKYKTTMPSCECLPSCTEADLKNIYSFEEQDVPGSTNLSISISMSMWPAYQFRRQSLRNKLDVVVSLGGILGLFLGASILSVIEFIYYFTYRAVNNLQVNRRTGQLSQQSLEEDEGSLSDIEIETGLVQDKYE